MACSGSGNSRMRATSVSRSARPAAAGNGAKRLAGRLRIGRAAGGGWARWAWAGAESLEACFKAAAAGADDRLEGVALERQRVRGRQGAEQAGRDHAVVLGR